MTLISDSYKLELTTLRKDLETDGDIKMKIDCKNVFIIETVSPISSTNHFSRYVNKLGRRRRIEEEYCNKVISRERLSVV